MLNVKKWMTKVIEHEYKLLSLSNTDGSEAAENNFYERIGNVVTVRLDFTPTVSGTTTTAATLPKSCRPLHLLMQPVAPISTQATWSGFHYFSFSADGSVRYYATSLNRMVGVVTFVCAGG